MIRISVAPSPRSSLTRYVLLSPESNWVISRLDTRVTCASTRTRSFHDPFLSHFSNYRFIEERDRSTLVRIILLLLLLLLLQEIQKLYSRIVEEEFNETERQFEIYTKIYKKRYRINRRRTPPPPRNITPLSKLSHPRWAYDTSGHPLPTLPRWLNEIK